MLTSFFLLFFFSLFFFAFFLSVRVVVGLCGGIGGLFDVRGRCGVVWCGGGKRERDGAGWPGRGPTGPGGR